MKKTIQLKPKKEARMKTKSQQIRKIQCPCCNAFKPATLEYFFKCQDRCQRWVCLECLKKNRCDFNRFHTLCPDCATRVRIKYRLPIYMTRCTACAEKYSDIHDSN